MRSIGQFSHKDLALFPLTAVCLASAAFAQDAPRHLTVSPPPLLAVCAPLDPDASVAFPPLWQLAPCGTSPHQTLAEADPGDGVGVRVRPDAEPCWQAQPVSPVVVHWLQTVLRWFAAQPHEE